MTWDTKAVGEHLRAIRKKAGLSQREVARKAGVSASYLCDLELGRRSALLRTLHRIIKVLGYKVVISLDQGE